MKPKSKAQEIGERIGHWLTLGAIFYCGRISVTDGWLKAASIFALFLLVLLASVGLATVMREQK